MNESTSWPPFLIVVLVAGVLVGIGYAGIGAGLIFSNATNLQQLSGPFESYTLSLPAVSFSFSHGGGIWELGFTLGPGLGLSHTYATSNTTVTGNTQPCP